MTHLDLLSWCIVKVYLLSGLPTPTVPCLPWEIRVFVPQRRTKRSRPFLSLTQVDSACLVDPVGKVMGQAESQQQVEIAGSPTDATSGTAQYKQQLSGANIPVSRETEEEAGERSVDSAIDHSSANTVTSVPVERSWSGMNIWRRLSSTLSWRASSLEVLKASEEKILVSVGTSRSRHKLIIMEHIILRYSHYST